MRFNCVFVRLDDTILESEVVKVGGCWTLENELDDSRSLWQGGTKMGI